LALISDLSVLARFPPLGEGLPVSDFWKTPRLPEGRAGKGKARPASGRRPDTGGRSGEIGRDPRARAGGTGFLPWRLARNATPEPLFGATAGWQAEFNNGNPPAGLEQSGDPADRRIKRSQSCPRSHLRHARRIDTEWRRRESRGSGRSQEPGQRQGADVPNQSFLTTRFTTQRTNYT